MAKAFFCVAVAFFLAGTNTWAQSGIYTKQFRVSPPAPTAPNPFSHATAHLSQPPFGKPTPQRFSISPFPDANRNLGVFIRNRIISSSPGHPRRECKQPTNIYVPWLPYSYGYPLDPYSYALPRVDPFSGQPNGLSERSSSFQIQASTGPMGKSQAKNARVTFKSNPAGAELYVDGNLVGDTPFTVPLAAGLHKISIQQWGYRDWQRTLTVSAGGEIVMDAILQGN